MPGSVALAATSDVNRIEAPVTLKAYLMCVFASFGGLFFGYDSGYISGVLGMNYYIHVSHVFLCSQRQRCQFAANALPRTSSCPATRGWLGLVVCGGIWWRPRRPDSIRRAALIRAVLI